MVRFLGFALGSAIGLGALLLFVGVPQIAGQRAPDSGTPSGASGASGASSGGAVISAHDARPAIPSGDSGVPNPSPAAPQAAEQPEPSASPPMGAPLDPPQEPDSVAAQDSYASIMSAEAREQPDGPAEFEQATQWHRFWNPFRSEIAAQGFVGQLEQVTGLDYRIVRLKPGVYEVAFPYADELERRSKLAQIQAATGLDLQADRP